MSDDENNVIPVDFSARRDEPTATTITPRRKANPLYARVTINGKEVGCAHARLEIDETTLDLECADCRSPIDHRVFVMEWARRQRSLHWSREEVAKLRAERDELKREVANLKAQKRRARP